MPRMTLTQTKRTERGWTRKRNWVSREFSESPGTWRFVSQRQNSSPPFQQVLLNDAEGSGALQSTDNDLDEDEAQISLQCGAISLDTVLWLVWWPTYESHSLDLSTPIPGWQRRELGSSETVDLGFGPDSLAVGLWFALKLVLFLRAYSLFLPGASVCVFPMRSDRRTLKKELCLFDSNVSFRSNPLEWFREQSSMPLSLSPSKTLWVDLGYDESELLGFLAKSI